MRALGWYRALLRLYPRQFRAEYGEDMVQLVGDQLRDESALRVVARTLVDVLISVPNRHLEAHMKRSAPLAVPLIFAAVSASALLAVLVVGSATGWVLFALVISAAAGTISWAATRDVRAIGSDRIASRWWKFLLAGAVGFAAFRVVDVLVDDAPDGLWFAYMVTIFLSLASAATGLILGAVRLSLRHRDAAA